MGKKYSKVILFSGGWDSTLCALKHPEADLLFINYGQIYFENEYNAAFSIADKLKKRLSYTEIPLKHDIKNRNFFLILEAVRMGYDEVILGTRNVFPVFDKYKDSNWLSLYILSKLLRVKITMPIIFYTKKRIVNYIRSFKLILNPYNCYNNLNDIKKCTCVNCLEMKNL